MKARPLALTVTLAITGLALAGCTTPAASGGGTDVVETVAIKVAVLPISDSAPLYIGIEQGIFAKYNLEVTPVPAAGGAAIVPLVASGDAQFGASTLASLFVAQESGLDLKAVSPISQSSEDGKTTTACILVRGDSPLTSLADLEGKTVGVPTLGSINDAILGAAMESEGAELSKVHLVEIPFPDVPAALANGTVDAAAGNEPFLTILGLDGSGKCLEDHYHTAHAAPLVTSTFFATSAYAKAAPEVVANFQAAYLEAVEYANAHQDEVRAIVPTYTQIPAAVAEKITIIPFPTKIDRESLEFQAAISKQFGLTTKLADVDSLLLP